MADEKKLSMVASRGTLDWAYPPFILGSAAAALDIQVQIFFTFYGLLLLKKDLNLKVSPLGNPAMPMKMPFGPKWFKGIDWPIPNLMMANIPGFESFATTLMKMTFKSHGVATIEDLREMCMESGVQFIGCQMTMDVFGFKKEEFIDGVEIGGAAMMLEFSSEADMMYFL